MPNAMNNKFKPRQLIKDKKENENIELWKRMRRTKDKTSPNRKETVWERLSKVGKLPSTENTLGTTRSHHNLKTKTSQPFETTRQMAGNQPQKRLQHPQAQTVYMSLSPNARFLNRLTDLPKVIAVPENPRSLNNSKSSLDNYEISNRLFLTADRVSAHLNLQASCGVGDAISSDKPIGESSEDSADEYKLAPLMSSLDTHLDPNSSTKIVDNFRELVRQKDKSMALEDVELAKNVIKSDHRNLSNNNPELFTDIFKTQLQDILKHEFAVKRALDKLDFSANLQNSQGVQTNERAEGIVINTHKEPQKLEVAVIFKNVPSLEKEIIILKALGEKLEATLRRTSFQKNGRIKSQESVALSAGTSLTKCQSIDRRVLLMVENKYETYILDVEQFSQVQVRALGICYFVGIVKEFCITQKTIDELNQEANRPFYIPINPQTAELKRTSFKKLKEHPDILLSHIKAKSSVTAFNLLEQDSVFFNNILFSKIPTSSKLSLSSTDEYYVEKEPLTLPALCEGGDSGFWKQNEDDNKISLQPVNIKETPNDQELSKLKYDGGKLIKPPKLMQSAIRGEQRRRIRRFLTPMPDKKYLNSKNTLLKTILVGSLQMQLFILLIIAFTYPGPKC